MRWIPFLLLIVVLASCNSKKPETREHKLNRGFDYIDQHHYDQAIAYFQNLLQEDSHPQVRIALASAYAARAGVKFDDIYNFVVVKHQPKMHIQIQGLNFSEQTTEVIHHLEAFLAQWDEVPDVSMEGRSDLENAVQVLAQTTNAGARLYSATLRVVILKRNVHEGYLTWNLRVQNKDKKLCTQDIQPWWQWSEKVLKALDTVGDDLQRAFPKRTDEFKLYRTQLSLVKSQMALVSIPLGEQCY